MIYHFDNKKQIDMKASEFRIGNLMSDRDGRLCEVTKLQKDECNDGWEVKASAIEGALTSLPCKPIPLTEEMLIKFGCYKLGSIFTTPEINGNRMYIRIDDKGNFYNLINEFTVVKLPFVHTFQNYVFALTGEELKFKP